MANLSDVTSTPVRPELVAFGRRLRQARERVDLKGTQLAAKLGLKRSAVAQYENGRSFPSVSVLKKLTQALGVTMDSLVFDEYEATAEIRDKELVEYFAKVDALQTRERRLIKDFIDSVLARSELEELKRANQKKGKAA